MTARPRLSRQEALQRILAEDIPTIPAHWHPDGCDCEPTVAYLRVSKVGKRTRIVSPQIQLNDIVAAAKRNNRRIIKLVFDINKTGQDFDREALQEVIGDVERGDYKHVSVWMWSRWGRTFRGSLAMINLLEAADGEVDSANEEYDRESIFGEHHRDSALLNAALQAKMIGKTWKSVHQTRRDSKLPHSGQKRFGYDYNTEDERNKHFTINEDEAHMLAWAYEKYVAGTSLIKIVNEVNARGFRTEFGSPWNRQSWSRLMDNGFAAGKFRSRSPALIKKMQRKNVSSKTRASFDTWTDGKHEPIISAELWAAYIRRRDEGLALAPRLVAGTHALSGILFCGECARRLTSRYVGQSRTHTWDCQGKAEFHPAVRVSISNKEAMAGVRNWVAERSQPGWVEAEARRRFDAAAKSTPELGRYQVELSDVDDKIGLWEAAYEKAGQSDFLRERALTKVQELGDRRVELEQKIREATPAIGQGPDWRAVQHIDQAWDELEPASQNALLRLALGMVVVRGRTTRYSRSEPERLDAVPIWEMGSWAGWLAARRHRSA